jgi:hypothetical protein
MSKFDQSRMGRQFAAERTSRPVFAFEDLSKRTAPLAAFFEDRSLLPKAPPSGKRFVDSEGT